MTTQASGTHAHRHASPNLPSNNLFSLNNFKSCKNTLQGAVFLIGSGKSAIHFPIKEFADTPMITMNGAISMFMGTGISPFFYTCTDRGFAHQQPELYATAMRDSQNVALWAEQFKTVRPQPRRCAYALKKAKRQSLLAKLFERNHAHIRKHSLLSKRKRDIGFSKDMEQGFFDARTVMYLALQIAYHVGFNKVFLVGFDLNQAAGRFYETAKSQCSPCGLDQHYESRILPSLELMAKHVVNKDFKVYNLSATSRVPTGVIPKITIDEVRQMLED